MNILMKEFKLQKIISDYYVPNVSTIERQYGKIKITTSKPYNPLIRRFM